MKNRPIIILAVLVLGICLGAVWFLRTPTVPPLVVEAAQAVPTPAPVSPGLPPPPLQTPVEKPVAVVPRPATPAPVAKPMAEWELKIENLLRASIPENETARLLIDLLPTLPPEGQAEAAQHISNLLLDKDYSRVLPLIKNPALSEEVLDVFVTDLMNRDDSVKLPTLLEIAKMPNHPHHEEALSDLQIFLDEDFGTDWAKWSNATKAYLKKVAAENSAEPQ